MNKRITRNIALILVVIMIYGSTLSLAASRKDIRKSSRLVYLPLGTRRIPNKTKPTFAARVQAASLLRGQTVTLLPDGSSLLIGGESDNGPQDGVAISDLRTGQPIPLKNRLHQARAWHSATMLPDGRILILGGIGENDAVVGSAEIFDPETQAFTLLPIPEIAARAYHSATLLTDGQVLIAGGSSAHAANSGNALVWDYRTIGFKPLPAKPLSVRQNHQATLLFDGNVLIEGGVDDHGNRVPTAELFDSESGNFTFSNISSEQADQAAPFLAATLPANGATDVPVDTLVGLRFSKQLRVETLNSETLVLTGPEGTLETKVVPAEGVDWHS